MMKKNEVKNPLKKNRAFLQILDCKNFKSLLNVATSMMALSEAAFCRNLKDKLLCILLEETLLHQVFNY